MTKPRRIDWLDDPNAPEINSLVPSASAVVVDEAGRVLLIHRTDNDLWSVPGGRHGVRRINQADRSSGDT
jgi:8-oxo-dGTP pyrophosphatase MutT (NUDIX family)